MTNKLKEILSKIGVFFSTVWDNLIVEAFRRLVSAIRGMVMIDGDVYFTTKQKKDGSPRVFTNSVSSGSVIEAMSTIFLVLFSK